MSICGSHLDDLEQVLPLIDSGLQYVSHFPAYSITITITTIVTTTIYCYFYQCQLGYMFFCLCEIGPHTLQLILVKCILASRYTALQSSSFELFTSNYVRHHMLTRFRLDFIYFH